MPLNSLELNIQDLVFGFHDGMLLGLRKNAGMMVSVAFGFGHPDSAAKLVRRAKRQSPNRRGTETD